MAALKFWEREPKISLVSIVLAGGTVSADVRKNGVFNVSKKAVSGLLNLVKIIPFIEYKIISLPFPPKDSSLYTEDEKITIAEIIMTEAKENGCVWLYGSDTAGKMAAIAGIVGAETCRHPAILCKAMNSFYEPNTDARPKILTAVMAAAFFKSTGVYEILDSNTLASWRRDKYRGRADPHLEGREKGVFSGKVILEKLVNPDFTKLVFDKGWIIPSIENAGDGKGVYSKQLKIYNEKVRYDKENAEFLKDKDMMLLGEDRESGAGMILALGDVRVDELAKFRIHRGPAIGYGYDFQGEVDGESAKQMFERAVKNTKEYSGRPHFETFVNSGVVKDRYGWYLTRLG